MPTLSNKAVLDITNACLICNETARRDERLLDALQMARFILTSRDVLLDPAARLERAKLAIDEAMKLMKLLRS